jgi:alpha-glucosidase
VQDVRGMCPIAHSQEELIAVSSVSWWRRAVVYQIYIRSFADANGDGIGDIAGIRSHLAYLRELGVDAIWTTPWYQSPMVDGGYDVADYRAIDPLFGTLDDARALVADVHAQGLRVIIDIVPNHTSSEHPWFREALATPRGSVARARYIFRNGRGPGGTKPPNNWSSIFGGSAWTPAPDDGGEPGQWYLHLFDSSQPDLNWENAEVRVEFESILDFWLDFGVDGFRIDVASFLVKAPGLPDLPAATVADPTGASKPSPHPFDDLEGVHEIYRRWRRIVERRGRDAVFCGEIGLPAARIARYLRRDELHTAFNFDFALRPWDAAEFRSSIDETLASHSAVGAPATWVLGNHDLPRPVFRYGRASDGGPWSAWERRATSDRALGLARARAAALLYLALPGSAYIYQGDELGLPEVLELPREARQDPTFHRSGGADLGRDGCRVPMPWEGDEPPFGFGPPASRPWLPQPAAWSGLTVDAETRDPRSMLALYRAALLVRRTRPGFADDTFRWLPSPPGTLMFARGGGFHCAVNLSGTAMWLPENRSDLLASFPISGDALAADSAAWFEIPTA